MSDLHLENIRAPAAKKIKPFFHDILDTYREEIHSLHVTGTAVTDDFDDRNSDINSIIVLKTMDLKFLESLAPLGKKYGKDRVAAPLIMTPEYIETSLDVFPVEFFNFKLIHSTVFGKDLFEYIEIDRMDLRQQCERELKTKLIWLRQGYLSTQGNRKLLTEGLVRSITDYIPLFRGIIALFGKEPPVGQREVITVLADSVNITTDVFAVILKEKHERIKLSLEELNTLFEDYYAATEQLGKIIDELQV